MRIWHQSFSDLDRAPLYRATLERHAAIAVGQQHRVTLHGLKPGTYGEHAAPIDALRYCYLEFMNTLQICEAALEAERAGYDAMALGCFHDPGLKQARSLVDIPVVSLSETCMLVACSLGQKFGIVALNRDQQLKHEELASAYELGGRLASSVCMTPGITEYDLEIEGDAVSVQVEAFTEACRRTLRAGAEIIIPGDGFLSEFAWKQGIAAVDGAPVMDALGTLFHYALFLAGARATLGLTASRFGSFARPPDAMLQHVRSLTGLERMRESDFSGRGAVLDQK